MSEFLFLNFILKYGSCVISLILVVASAMEVDVDVAIVGSGAAGIAAATALATDGFRVVVLEAENRTGGRIWTDDSLGCPLDLGAAWISMGKQNPVYKIAHNAGLITSTFNDSKLGYAWKGSTTAIPWQYDDYFYALEEELYERSFTVNFAESVGEAWRALKANYPEAAHEYIEALLLSVYELQWSTPLNNLSLKGAFLQYDSEVCKDPWLMDDDYSEHLIRNGYDQVLEHLGNSGGGVRRLRSSGDAAAYEVRTMSQVQQISQPEGEQNIVVLRLADGEQVVAKTVIITVSIGVLMAGGITFSPPLPTAKADAIAHSAMGYLEKIVLQFDSLPRNLQEMQGFYDLTAIQQGKVGTFINMAATNATSCKQPIIVGLGAASTARRFEGMTETDIVAETVATLREHFPSLPEIVSSIVTRWGTNPNTHGAYSSWPTTKTLADFDVLTKLDGHVVFSGEGTSPCNYGYVHGAILQGRRAATQVKELLQDSTTLTCGMAKNIYKRNYCCNNPHKLVELPVGRRMSGMLMVDELLERVDSALRTGRVGGRKIDPRVLAKRIRDILPKHTYSA